MKKFVILILCSMLLIGCGQKEKPSKLSDEAMAQFSYNSELIIQENKPDLVSMDYLVKHAKKYAQEFPYDEDNFFVIVKGKVTDINMTDYSKEDLSIMENKDAAELLINMVSYDYFLDSNKQPLFNSVRNEDSPLDIETGKEYYFMVNVSDMSDGYYYSIRGACEVE